MAEAINLAIDCKPMRDSLASVLAELENLAASGDALEHVLNFTGGMIASDGSGGFDLRFDGDDLVVGEPVSFAASGAHPLEGFKIAPSDRYLRLVAAIASERDTYSVRFIHLWPILSVAVPAATVADGERAENASLAGGCA